MANRATFFLAGNSRSRSGRESMRAAKRALEDLGGKTEAVSPRHPWELRAAVRAALARGYRNIVAVGGDGTVRLVAAALAGSEAVLGIIPAGTGNDFARTLQLPTDPAEAARVLLRGHSRFVDLGLVNERPFVNAASIGLSAEVAHEVTAAQKRKLGRLAYPLTAGRLLLSHRPFRVRVSGDVSFEGWTHQVVIANGRFQGGGTPTLPEADPESGKLAAYVVEGKSRVTLFLIGLLVRFGQHTELAPTVTFEGRRFRVETDRPRRINADGEEIGSTPAQFSVRPRALEVFVPEAALGGKANDRALGNTSPEGCRRGGPCGRPGTGPPWGRGQDKPSPTRRGRRAEI